MSNKKANDTDIAVNAKEMEAAFEALAGCATIESGRIMTIDPTSNQGVTKISVINAQKDPKLNKTLRDSRCFYRTALADSSSSAAFQSTPPVPLGKAIATIPSPSGKLFLSIYSDESGAEQQSISSTYTFVISDAAENLHTIRSKGLHKQIFLKGNLGGISWSLDETKIVYVAEPKATETSHFFSSDKDKKNGLGEKGLKDVQEGKDVTAPAGKDESKGRPFEFSEHWGEIMTKATSPKPFLIDIRLESVIPFKGAPKNVSFGQVQFCPDGKSIVVVGFPETPRRMGLTYYNSRPSSLYCCKLPEPETASSTVDGSDNKDATVHSQGKGRGGGDEKGGGGEGGGNNSGDWQVLTVDSSALNPRFSPDGKKLLYTSTDKVWYHYSCSRMRLLRWPIPPAAEVRQNKAEDHAETIVEIVHDVGKKANDDYFPGLWIFLLPERVWLEDSQHVVFHSLWNMQYRALCVDTNTGLIRILQGAANINSKASIVVLDVKGDFVLLKSSTPTQPQQLHIARVLTEKVHPTAEAATDDDKKAGRADGTTTAPSSPTTTTFTTSTTSFTRKNIVVKVAPAEWESVSKPFSIRNQNVAKAVEDAIFRIETIKPSKVEKGKEDEYIQVLLISPTSSPNQKIPLVLRPHGGPHSGFSTNFDWGNAFMVSQGFAVACVNYRGSIGYGMSMLSSLPGHCGRQDVDDCMDALRHVLKLKIETKAYPKATSSKSDVLSYDKDNVMVWGGSHGGFLTTHLIGQFPETFCRAATRNPVTNCAFMVTETDIPDWCYIEGGLGPYHPGKFLSREQMAKLYNMSPIAYASNIRTPLLMLLGMKDLRVPPSQGLNFFKTLKAKGVETRCLTYPESTHSLSDSVRTEADVWINVVHWFKMRS